MEAGIRRAISLWETSAHWVSRAHAAISHAAYVARPDVVARRIKTTEADRRKAMKNIYEATKFIRAWNNPEKEITKERAQIIADYSHYYFEIDGKKDSLYGHIKGDRITPEQ